MMVPKIQNQKTKIFFYQNIKDLLHNKQKLETFLP